MRVYGQPNKRKKQKNRYNTNMNVLELSEQEIGRRESLQELRQMGNNPYPAAE